MPACLFVYGTLRSEFSNRWARLLRNHARHLGKGRLRGRIYRMRGYPALRRSIGEEWVTGEIYLLRDTDSLLPKLDGYEDKSYRRVRAGAKLGESSVRVWVYEWRHRLPQWRRISSGDFLSDIQ